MKSTFKMLFFLCISFVMVGMFTSCSEDDDSLSGGGKPMVSYVRVTRPAASDSLLVKAGQGATIAIVGENLQNARELWINDQQAVLTPTFITSTSIITRVPTEIPEEITNKMRIVFANGEEVVHDFMVDISEPSITGMLSEYVNTGETATITGNYFYAPVKVTFAGGVEGEVVTVEDDVIEVTVPEGAEPGPITITTNFGETESEFWFRDNRNIIASFDAGATGMWHAADYIKTTDPDIMAINGKFLRFNKNLPANPWAEFYVGPNNSVAATETKNIPADALANPGKYSLKFEISTIGSLTGAEMRMYMGTGDMGTERNSNFYNWKPNLDTKGEWQTVTIPFAEFYAANKAFPFRAEGYGVSFWFHGPLAVNTNFAMDNLRVVPNTIP